MFILFGRIILPDTGCCIFFQPIKYFISLFSSVPFFWWEVGCNSYSHFSVDTMFYYPDFFKICICHLLSTVWIRYAQVQNVSYLSFLVFSDLPGSKVWWLPIILKQSMVIISNISSVSLFLLLILQLQLHICYIFCSCSTALRYCFCHFFLFIFLFRKCLLMYLQAHWFFLQQFPVSWWFHQRPSSFLLRCFWSLGLTFDSFLEFPYLLTLAIVCYVTYFVLQSS